MAASLAHPPAPMTKTDTACLRVLAESYRREAELCRRMAGEASGPRKEEWLQLSAEWIRLEADTMWWLNAGSRDLSTNHHEQSERQLSALFTESCTNSGAE